MKIYFLGFLICWAMLMSLSRNFTHQDPLCTFYYEIKINKQTLLYPISDNHFRITLRIDNDILIWRYEKKEINGYIFRDEITSHFFKLRQFCSTFQIHIIVNIKHMSNCKSLKLERLLHNGKHISQLSFAMKKKCKSLYNMIVLRCSYFSIVFSFNE